MVFAQNFNTGIYPSIIKTYAEGKKSEMLGLVLNGSKLTFFLMWVFGLPLLVEMETVLNLWLENPPELAVLFTRLAIVESLILSLSLPIATAARAPGKMKFYELSLGSIQLLMFMASWLLLRAGYPAESVFVAAIVANIVMFKVRLLIVKRLVGMPLTPYYRHVLLPIGVIMLVSGLATVWLRAWLPSGYIFVIVVIAFSVVLSTFCMYYLGLDRLWRQKSKEMIISRLAKLW
jgi:O-antigen/teichoic acid export membrane protein